jgi:hypothetical protein
MIGWKDDAMEQRRERGRLLLAAPVAMAGLAAGWISGAAAQPPVHDGAVAETLRRGGGTPSEAMIRGTDAKSREAAIERVARSYDLPPALLNLRDRLPDDPQAVMDRLGLIRRDGAPRTDLSHRDPPSAGEIFDALAPR